MHPRIAEVLGHLEAQRATLEQAVASVPPERRHERPAPDSWSVAEVLGHLAIVEGQITELLRARIASGRQRGVGAETSTTSVLSSIDMAPLLERRRKVMAGTNAHPPPGIDAESAWAELVAKREVLRAVIHDAEGFAFEEIGAKNPVLGPLNGYQWLIFLGYHEGRHAAQVREIGTSLPREQ
jgi:hypothetical protein